MRRVPVFSVPHFLTPHPPLARSPFSRRRRLLQEAVGGASPRPAFPCPTMRTSSSAAKRRRKAGIHEARCLRFPVIFPICSHRFFFARRGFGRILGIFLCFASSHTRHDAPKKAKKTPPQSSFRSCGGLFGCCGCGKRQIKEQATRPASHRCRKTHTSGGSSEITSW